MARMKTFLRYLIIFVVVYFLFDFFAYRYLANTYKNIQTYEIEESNLKVTINEAKATAVNGYVNAKVKNETGEKIDKKYVRIDLYTAKGNNVGTQYVAIENLEPDVAIEFNQKFKAKNVKHIKIGFTDTNVDAEIERQTKELKENANKWLPFVGLATLIAIA